MLDRNRIPQGYSQTADPIIFQSANSIVIRCIREEDNVPVICKLTEDETPSNAQLDQINKDHEISVLLTNYDYILQSLEKFSLPRGVVLVKEDFQAINLKQYIDTVGGKLTSDTFLPLAIKLTEILSYVHQNRVLHLDVKPQNVLINPQSKQLKVCDFSSSEVVSAKNPSIKKLEGQPSGTIYYMAPEQTGKLDNALLDTRTDVYSLGASFYQLLSGKVPFDSIDNSEIIHGHVAKPAEPIANISQALWKVVQKMMEKDPNLRYQTMRGIQKDLLYIQATPNAPDSWKPGANDVSDSFSLSSKLYGRSAEMEILSNVATDVEIRSRPGLVLISGYSGIGKSVLVSELKNMYPSRFIFASGKYDQINKGVPFSAIADSITCLVDTVLGEAQTYIAEMKLKILEALHGDGALLTDLSPSLKYIIGEQEPIANQDSITGSELTNKIFTAVIEFYRVFTKGDRTLCLFIDDLQWSDLDSLHLIERIMTTLQLKLLLIGAYRDNEVPPSHPLNFTIEAIAKEKCEITEIKVGPLKIEDLNEMIADSLKLTPAETESFSELVMAKTNGNPFFSKEFLVTLANKELIRFDYEKEIWTWDVDAISEQNFSDNVVEFMLANLRHYKDETLNVLRYASVIGNSFNIEELSQFYGKTPEQTKFDLLEAVQEGWILSRGDNCRFLHDRLQQAAYDSMPEEDKLAAHFELGYKLLAKMAGDPHLLFDVVAHLNKCHKTICKESEKTQQIAQLNIDAARKAIESSASEPALVYSNAANALVDSIGNECPYELAFTAKFTLVESMILSKQFDQSLDLSAELAKLTQTRIHKLRVLHQRIIAFNSLSRYDDTYDLVVEVVKENSEDLGEKINLNSDMDAGIWIQTVAPTVFGKLPTFLPTIAEAPAMTDETYIAFNNLIVAGSPSFFMSIKSSKTLFAAVCILLGNIAMTYGICSSSVTGIAVFGIIYTSITNDWVTGSILTNAALGLATHRIKSEKLRCQITFFTSMFMPVSGTISDQVKSYREGFLLGLKTGDNVWGSYCCTWTLALALFQGNSISDLNSLFTKHNDYVSKLNSPLHSTFLILIEQVMGSITGRTDCFDPASFPIPIEYQLQLPFSRSNYLFLSSLLEYFADRNTVALGQLRQNDQYLADLGNFFYLHHSFLFKSMVVVEELSRNDLPESEKTLLLEELKALIEKVGGFDQQFPRYSIAVSELLKAENMNQFNIGTEFEVMQQYQKAVSTAVETEYYLLHCAACTRFASYLESKNFGSVFVSAAALEALRAWTRMGAAVKVAKIQAKYSHLLKSYAMNLDQSSTKPTHISDPQAQVQGWKTSQNPTSLLTGSDEIEISQLFIYMLNIINENTAADRTCFILNGDDGFKFVAETSISSNGEVQMVEQPLTDCGNKLCLPLINRVLNSRRNLVVSDAATHTDYQSIPYISNTQMKSIMCTPILHKLEVLGVIYTENSKLLGAFTEQRALVLKTIIDVSIENCQVFTTLNQAYARFLPKPFLHQLNKTSVTEIIAGDAVEKKMTVLFSDIRDFTSITEKMTAQRSFSFVNQFLEFIAPEIDNRGGFIDKFIGDAIMALFPHDVDSALVSTLGMVSALKEYNKNSGLDHNVNIGIGLHYGPLMLGTVGYSARLNATVISDTVNIASRLEGLTKGFGVTILVSNNVIENLKAKATYRRIGRFLLKGKEIPYELFEIYDPKWDSHKDLDKLNNFQKALEVFCSRKLHDALKMFTNLNKSYPADKLIKFYKDVTELYLDAIPQQWSGEIKLDKDGNAQPLLKVSPPAITAPPKSEPLQLSEPVLSSDAEDITTLKNQILWFEAKVQSLEKSRNNDASLIEKYAGEVKSKQDELAAYEKKIQDLNAALKNVRSESPRGGCFGRRKSARSNKIEPIGNETP